MLAISSSLPIWSAILPHQKHNQAFGFASYTKKQSTGMSACLLLRNSQPSLVRYLSPLQRRMKRGRW